MKAPIIPKPPWVERIRTLANAIVEAFQILEYTVDRISASAEHIFSVTADTLTRFFQSSKPLIFHILAWGTLIYFAFEYLRHHLF